MSTQVDQFPSLYEAMTSTFSSFSNEQLFTTNAEGLSEAFLDNLPLDMRQEYTCNSCRNFVRHFGGLVAINDKGQMQSVFWNEDKVPAMFYKSIKAMKEIILNSRVDGLFYSNVETLGTPKTGLWNHMSAKLPKSKVFNSRLKNADQEMAKMKEEFKSLNNGLNAFSLEVVEKSLTLLQSGSLPRADRFVGQAQLLKELHEKRNKAKNARQRDNITWLSVANAPEGFCHIKNSMLGTLLQDVADNLQVSIIIARFSEKVDPANYMRAQAAPNAGNIKQAEIIVEKLGIANSLMRRFARYDEIPNFLWRGKDIAKKVVEKTGVFANITPREKQAEPTNVMNLPKTTMTWDKVARTVLPTADNVEVFVDNPSRFMALVTASDEKAPNILQWDNTFSWYYHGGIDGEIKRRVEQAGGRYENNEIRCSLIWENYTDLDLHCITPSGQHIYYGDKKKGEGWLDIDMNAGGGNTNKPVENIRWVSGQAPQGSYRFYVHNYAERGDKPGYGINRGSTPFKVELEINGKIYSFSGSLRDKQQVDVFTFTYVKGQQPAISAASIVSNDAWNVPTNTFVKVKSVVQSPNMWGEQKAAHVGDHTFFLLDGCKDFSEGKGRGFFVETLKSDLHEVRKTLEAYTANEPISGVEEASACGVGYSKDSEWNLTLRVTSNNATRLILVDRFD